MDDAEPVIDPMLQAIVAVCNGTATNAGISVMVGGTWISGTTITPRMFTQEVGDLIEERAGDHGKAFRVVFDRIGTEWFPSDSELEARGEEPASGRDAPQFLHLRGARAVVDGDTSLPDAGALVRIRLDEVGAWLIGELGTPRAPGVPPPTTP